MRPGLLRGDVVVSEEEGRRLAGKKAAREKEREKERGRWRERDLMAGPIAPADNLPTTGLSPSKEAIARTA